MEDFNERDLRIAYAVVNYSLREGLDESAFSNEKKACEKQRKKAAKILRLVGQNLESEEYYLIRKRWLYYLEQQKEYLRKYGSKIIWEKFLEEKGSFQAIENAVRNQAVFVFSGTINDGKNNYIGDGARGSDFYGRLEKKEEDIYEEEIPF